LLVVVLPNGHWNFLGDVVWTPNTTGHLDNAASTACATAVPVTAMTTGHDTGHVLKMTLISANLPRRLNLYRAAYRSNTFSGLGVRNGDSEFLFDFFPDRAANVVVDGPDLLHRNRNHHLSSDLSGFRNAAMDGDGPLLDLGTILSAVDRACLRYHHVAVNNSLDRLERGRTILNTGGATASTTRFRELRSCNRGHGEYRHHPQNPFQLYHSSDHFVLLVMQASGSWRPQYLGVQNACSAYYGDYILTPGEMEEGSE
jgi:hypothetical protein